MKQFAYAAVVLALVTAAPTQAHEPVRIARVDAEQVMLLREKPQPASVWLSRDTLLDKNDQLLAQNSTQERITLALPATERRYVIAKATNGDATVVAERELPLEQGSNFRDIGGYKTKDGRTVRWGKAFRSGALPVLSERDYGLLGTLGIDSIVDLRSLEEREVAPDLLDDRTGALFLANDYSIKPLFAQMGQGSGENVYRGMEKLLAPQFRSIFRRVLADEGAVVYHCSAGQDRTGIATALIYDVLGVDRKTILADYHLSTQLRRPQHEMPALDPADYPDNPIVQYYARKRASGDLKPEPLYSRAGVSHLAQFFDHIDAQYGGVAAYLSKELGITARDIEKLRTIMLR